MIDARGIPTCTCPNCNGDLFRILASFDPNSYIVSMYHLDMQCDNCGALCTAPTPLDHPENPDQSRGEKS